MDLLTIGAARLGIGSGASILSSLSQVAKTGDYDDLKNKPTYIKSIVASGNELTIENGDSSIATVILPRDTDIIDKYIVGSNGSVITDREGNKITARDTIGEIATSTRSGLMSSGDYNKTSRTNGGTNGRYWTATSYGVDSAYRLGFQPGKMSVNGNYEKWDAFAVRCVHGSVGESSPEAIEDEPVASPLQTTPTPVDNYNIPEEVESVNENNQASDSYATPQGVSEQTMRSTEETIDDMPVVIISTTVVAAVSTIGVIAVALYRNDDKEKEDIAKTKS